MTTFAAQVADWARRSEVALATIFKESVAVTVEEMLTPGPSVAATKAAISKGLGGTGRGRNRKKIQGPVPSPGAGGHMPIDSGYLRASLLASTSSMPAMREGAVPEPGKKYPYSPEPINLVIAGAELGQIIYAGFVAEYAAAVNFGTRGNQPRLFVELAAQNWQRNVDRVSADVFRRLGL